MAENGRSRVYLGIHFDFDDLVGQEVGQAIAASVAADFAALNESSGASDGSDASDALDSSFAISGAVIAAPEFDDFTAISREVSDTDLSLLAQDQVNQRGNQRLDQARGQTGGDRQTEKNEGVEGVTVELLDSNGELVAQTTTDSRGRYTFDAISDAGTYQVQIASTDMWIVLGEDVHEVELTDVDNLIMRINFQVQLA